MGCPILIILSARLREARIMIIEENESFAGAGGYVGALRKLVGGN